MDHMRKFLNFEKIQELTNSQKEGMRTLQFLFKNIPYKLSFLIKVMIRQNKEFFTKLFFSLRKKLNPLANRD